MIVRNQPDLTQSTTYIYPCLHISIVVFTSIYEKLRDPDTLKY